MKKEISKEKLTTLIYISDIISKYKIEMFKELLDRYDDYIKSSSSSSSTATMPRIDNMSKHYTIMKLEEVYNIIRRTNNDKRL